MPDSSESANRRSPSRWFEPLAFSAIIVLLIITGLIGFHNVRQLRRNTEEVDHAHQFLLALSALETTVSNAETGQRGFLIMGEPADAEPSQNALLEIESQLRSLEELAAGDPEQRDAVDELGQTVAAKWMELEDALNVRRDQGMDAAVDMVAAHLGKGTMETLRGQVSRLRGRQLALLGERRRAFEQSYRMALIAGWLSMIAALVLVSGVLYLVQRNRRRSIKFTAALQREREQLVVTLASIGDAVISTDVRGRITFANRVALSLLGRSSAETVGQSVEGVFRIVHEKTRQSIENPAMQVLREGHSLALTEPMLLVREDGREIPIDDSAAPILSREGRSVGAVLVFRDIVQRRRFERAQADQIRVMALRAKIGEALVRSDTLSDFLAQSAALIHDDLEGRLVQIWLCDEDPSFLEQVASTPTGEPGPGSPPRLPRGTGWIGSVAASGQPATADLRSLDAELRLGLSEAITAVAGFPLMVGGRAIGVIAVSSTEELDPAILDHLAFVARDITAGIESKRAEQKIRDGYDFTRTVIDSLSESLVVLDDHLKVHTVNKAFLRTFRETSQNTVGRYIYELGNDQWNIPALRNLLNAIHQDDQSFENFEVTHHFPNIGERTVLLNAHRFQRQGDRQRLILLAIRDVTEQRRADLERQSIDRQFRMFMEQVSDYAIFMIDTDLNIATWNQGVQQVLGYSEEEFVGQNVLSLIFTPDAIADGSAAREFEIAALNGEASDDRWMTRKGGTPFWASGITTGVHDDQGNLLGYNKVMRDLTHRKQSEDELKALATALAEADRNKSEFLATLAHELRNPMAPIKNAVQLMGLSELDDEVEQLRQTMERQVQQIVRLIDDLMDVSRIGRGKVSLRMETVSLHTLVAAAVEASQSFIEESGQELSVIQPEQEILLHADPARITQVISNLLNNASKYSPAGCSIELRTALQDGQAVISVQDQGIGIPAEHLSDIFKMFSQVGDSVERGSAGLGIGLTLVKTLVELHGGVVTATSDGTNKGSQFVVCLPTADEAVGRSPSSPSAEDGQDSRPFRVLVVDDTKAIAFVMQRLLTALGHEVQIAESGAEALEKLSHFTPEVVFSDISMPGMSGYELVKRLRGREDVRHAYFVAMTGYGQSTDREKAIGAGFDEHVVKPVDIRELRNMFQKLSSASV